MLAFKPNYSRFTIFSPGGHFAHWSGTVLAILGQGQLSDIPMKFNSNQPRGVGGVDV